MNKIAKILTITGIMNRKLLLFSIGMALVLTAVLVAASVESRGEYATTEIDGTKLQFETSRAFCQMYKFDEGTTSISYYSGYVNGDGTVIYFDPTDPTTNGCNEPTPYPFEITSLSFMLWDWGVAQWPVTLDVVVYDLAMAEDPCYGPGALICSEPVICDKSSFDGVMGTVTFSNPCCVNAPFFIGFHYNDAGAGPFPSVTLDNSAEAPVPIECDIWDYWGGSWKEWYSSWSDPIPNYPLFIVDGDTEAENCGEPVVGQCCYGNPSSPSCADELETNCVARPDFISWDRYLDCTTPCPNPPEGRCCYGDPYMPSCINETESECLGRGDYISWNEYYDCSIPCPPASIDTANMIFTAFCPQAVRENILVSSDFAIGIKIDNTIPLPTYDWCGGGFSFKFYSPDHSITNITHRSVSGGAGSTQSIEYLNNFSSMFNIGIFISEFSWDGSLPDSINFQVIGFDCMPPALPDQEYIRFHLTTDQEGIFCIDSLEFDNSTYNWLFGDPFTASFNGPFCLNIMADGDSDSDGIPNAYDNCPNTFNPSQEDLDEDDFGNACDDLTVAFDADPKWGLDELVVTFTDLSQSEDPIDSYFWSFGDGSYSTNSNPVNNYTNPGSYNVTHIIASGTLADTLQKLNYILVEGSADTLDFAINGISAGTDVWSIKSVDLNRDNNADLVFTSGKLHYLSVAYGVGDGTFDTPITYLTGYDEFAFAFINRDTLLDIIAGGSLAGSIAAMLNDGIGGFTVSSFAHFSENHCDVACGYFDDDVYVDVVASPNNIYFGNGQGEFPTKLIFSKAFKLVEAGDFNNDSIDDLVIFNDSAIILINDGYGGFTKSSSTYFGNIPYDINISGALTDFNHDDNLDIAMILPKFTPINESMISIFFGDGAGGILKVDSIGVDSVAQFLDVADVDHDNNMDIAVCNLNQKKLSIYYGNELGEFDVHSVVTLLVDYYSTAFTSDDFDRDGNQDFIAGPWTAKYNSSINDSITMASDLSAPLTELADEMVVTGFGDVSIEVRNPIQLAISNDFSTVAGSDYWRHDFDGDGVLDETSFDYNLQYGEYKIIMTPKPAATRLLGTYMAIRINGSNQVHTFYNYDLSLDPSEEFIFYYTVEEESSMQPPNGKATGSLPTFDWSGLLDGERGANLYHFQLDPFYDFRDPLYDITDLISPTFRPTIPLGTDSVFYWRFQTYDGGDWSEYSRTMAVYIVEYVCGDVDGDADELVNILDIVYLINYKYKEGPEPLCSPITVCADVNSDELINILDIIYLINYKYKGGPEPVYQ